MNTSPSLPPNSSGVADRVMKRIESDHLQVETKTATERQMLLHYGVLIAIMLAVVYIASLFLYEVATARLLWLPGFGLRGIRLLAHSWPWILMVVLLGSIFATELLGRRYLPTYRKPIVATLGIMAFVVGLLGWWIAHTAFHPTLARRMPIMYRHQMELPANTSIGRIQSFIPSGFRMLVLERGSDDATDLRDVVVSEATRFPRGRELRPGQVVFVIGEEEGGRITARGIRVVPEDDPFRHATMMRRMMGGPRR